MTRALGSTLIYKLLLVLRTSVSAAPQFSDICVTDKVDTSRSSGQASDSSSDSSSSSSSEDSESEDSGQESLSNVKKRKH